MSAPTRARESRDARGDRRRNSFRIATLNVWGRAADWSARLKALCHCWPRIDADVLLLQEVQREHTAWQASSIADALGLTVAATVDGHDYGAVDEGLAILAHVEPERILCVTLPPSTPPRRALVATLPIGAATVTVATAHAVPVPTPARREQIKALLGRSEAPLLIGGDLNATPNELTPLLKDTGLIDPLTRRRELTTWPLSARLFAEEWASRTGMPPPFRLDPKRIDYVLARGLTVTAAGIDPLAGPDGTFASDHALVWADCSPASGQPVVRVE